MEGLFKAFLVLHIIGGSIGLLTGTINLVRRKGGRVHKIIGYLLHLLSYGQISLE